jgi:hypothetical protein
VLSRVVWSGRGENSHGPNPADPARATPGLHGGAPQPGGGAAEGQPADAAGLGRSDDLVGGGPADRQDVAVEVAHLQRGEFAAAGAGVGRQPGKQQDLFGLVQARRGRRTPYRRGRHIAFGPDQDGADRLHRRVQPDPGLRRAAHPVQRVAVQDSLGVGPAERRAEAAQPARHRGLRPTRLPPRRAGSPHHHRARLQGPAAGDPIVSQKPHDRAVPADGGGPPTVIGVQPGGEQFSHRQARAQAEPGPQPSACSAHRRLASSATVSSPWTVTDRRRLTPLTGSGPSATRTSHTPGRRCRSDPAPRALRITDTRPSRALRRSGMRQPSVGPTVGHHHRDHLASTAERVTAQQVELARPKGLEPLASQIRIRLLMAFSPFRGRPVRPAAAEY